MATVRDPCNADAHAKIPALFIPMLYPLLRNMFNNVCASSLPKNVIFYVCVRMGNTAYITFIMWNSISDTPSYNVTS